MAVSLDITNDTTRSALAARADTRANGAAKGSLIGLTREELGQALIGVGLKNVTAGNKSLEGAIELGLSAKRTAEARKALAEGNASK